MFATIRTDRVMGRMMLLVVSIITINLVSIRGVPWGTMCVNVFLVCFIHLIKLMDSHIDKAIGMTVLNWPFIEGFGVYNPTMLVIHRIMNSLAIMVFCPFFTFFIINKISIADFLLIFVVVFSILLLNFPLILNSTRNSGRMK
jgi:hypothetical protein